MKKRRALVFFILCFSLCAGLQLYGATITSTSSGGDWSSTSSWVGGIIPTSMDDVVITSSITVTSQVVWETFCQTLTVETTGTLTIKALLTVLGAITNHGTISGNKWIYCKGAINNNGDWTINETFVNGAGIIQPITTSSSTYFNTTLHIQNNIISLSNVAINGSIDFDDSFYWDVNLFQLELINNAQILGDVSGILKNAVLCGQGHISNLNLLSVKNIGDMHFNNARFYALFENAGKITCDNWNVAYGDIINSGTWSGSTVYLDGSSDQTISYISLKFKIQFNGNYYKDGVMYWQVINPTEDDYGIYSNRSRNIIFQGYSSQYVWTGQIDCDWNKDGNWSTNQVPIETSNVRIPPVTNNPDISSDLIVSVSSVLLESSAILTINGMLVINNIETGESDLRIESGATTIVMPSGRLETGTGGIVNNAGVSGLIIDSSSDGTGSVIHQTDNVPAIVRRYIGGNAEDWHFLASPVLSQYISGNWTPSGTYGDGTGYDLYVWDEPSSCWVYNLNTSVSPTWQQVHPQSSFIPGRGYLYATQIANPIKQFCGSLGNGMVTYSVDVNAISDYTGFNLLGNPYPSSIDWKDDSGFNRGMLYLNGGGYDIWTWSSTANNYGVYNSSDTDNIGTNNVSRYIAPMQGFFVQAVTSGTFEFNNNSRVHDGAGDWLKCASLDVSNNYIRLTVQSESGLGCDEVKFDFGHMHNENGAKKLFSPVKTAPSLYLPFNAEKYTVRHLTDTIENQTISLGFKSGKDGAYMFRCIYDKERIGTIYIEDLLTGTIHDFNHSEIYSFFSKTNDPSNRFVIYFGSVIPENKNVKVFVSQGYLNVNLENMIGTFKIQVTDILGRIIYQQNLYGMQMTSLPLKSHGVYVISLRSSTYYKSFKVMY